jgi:hypothetical protein
LKVHAKSQKEIRSMLDRGFARLCRRPDLLIGFFHNASLSVRQLRLTGIKPINFLVNLICGLIAYSCQPKKPSLGFGTLSALLA